MKHFNYCLHGHDNKINGIYGIVGIKYLSNSQVQMTLRRSSAFDQTDELDGRRYVRVSDGSSDGMASSTGKVFASNGFTNLNDDFDNPTPLFVDAVQSRSGFVLANAITTRALPAEKLENGDILATVDGSLSLYSNYFDDVVLGVGRRVLINQPLAGSTTTDHYGVYNVVESGNYNTKWRLERYEGIDEDGDGELKTGLFWRPKEGFAFSNSYSPKGPPKFKKAAIILEHGVPVEIELNY